MEEIEEKIEEEKMSEEFKKLKEKWKLVRKAASILRVEDEHLPRVVDRFLKEIKEMEEKLRQG